MNDNELTKRIVLDSRIKVGKPVVKGTRLTVEYIVGLLAQGVSFSEIIEEYEGLTREDIQACLSFATRSLQSTVFMPLALEPA